MNLRQPPPSRAYFEPLTAFRGIAAFIVFLFHTGHYQLGAHFVAATHLVTNGYVFVDFFFLLSGFVIAHAHGNDFRGNVSASPLKAYLASRFARIYPLHVATLALVIAVYLARRWLLDGENMAVARLERPEAFSAEAIVTNLLLVQAFGLHPTVTWNYPAWSISCEFYVYLLFPFLIQACASGSKWLNGARVVAAAILLTAIFFANTPNTLDGRMGFNVFRCLAEFTIGILLYEVHRRGAWARILASSTLAWSALAATLVSLHVGIADLLLVPQFALLILVGAANTGTFRRVFCARPLQYLGRISYSIYLVHFPVLFAFDVAIQSIWGADVLGGLSLQHRLLGTLLCLPVVIGLAHLSHRFIEIEFSRALARRLRARIAIRGTLANTADG
jgi:peptidoglycan/LPS O-acetylase OafA/YrhL